MIVRRFLQSTFVAALTSLAAASAWSAPSTWNYSQSFGTDGLVSGSFVGDDLNGDGLITFANGVGNELVSISVSFTGGLYTGSWTAAEMSVGGVDSNVVEFQYIVGTPDFDATLSGPPAQASVVTLVTPVSAATQPSNSYMYWTAGSATYDPAGTFKGNVMYFDTDSNQLADYQATNKLLVTPTAAVPEPSEYALLAGGLAVVGAMVRRRSTRRVAR